MQNTYIWKVIPSGKPAVIRSCPKCGNNSEYECTGNFRVNANQNHIDVWLIYQCTKCKSTWNMEILSRVNHKTINKELYQKYQSNDPELAAYYAFDTASHSKNKSVLSNDSLQLDIEGSDIKLCDLKDAINILIECKYPLDIRLDKIISRKLGITRDQVKKMGLSGILSAEGFKDLGKARLKSGMVLTISPIIN